MALSIKSDEADRLARRVAAATGESLADAVVVSLRERLERLRAAREPSLVERVRRLQAEAAELAVLDRRSPEEIIGYDTDGDPARRAAVRDVSQGAGRGGGAMSTVRWSDVRRKHVEAIGEAKVERGKARLLAQERAHRLAEMRKRRGLPQRQVAQTMGVTVGRVSQIENGELAGSTCWTGMDTRSVATCRSWPTSETSRSTSPRWLVRRG